MRDETAGSRADRRARPQAGERQAAQFDLSLPECFNFAVSDAVNLALRQPNFEISPFLVGAIAGMEPRDPESGLFMDGA
jgi:hypothetical protein